MEGLHFNPLRQGCVKKSPMCPQPVKTLHVGSISKKPKDHPTESHIKEIEYEVKCKTGDFTEKVIGMSWNSPGAEQKQGVKRSNNESPMRHHAETTDHDIHPDYVEILERTIGKNGFCRSFILHLKP